MYAQVSFASLNRQQQEMLQQQHQQQLEMMANLPRIGVSAVEYATITKAGFSSPSSSSSLSPAKSGRKNTRVSIMSNSPLNGNGSTTTAVQGSPKFESTV